ncbi:MAG: lipid-A-disaccharide synthase [Alphaproteobacteria bacterium]|nr:lipid-A-disaccharide synthase [Alphaproteobacteria bacterium]
MKKIFIIAGEPSGDALGANLIKALRTQAEGDIEIIGIGGSLMEAQGFKSLLPMDELCVMGLVEVVCQLPRLLRLINGVVEEIEKQDPDVVVTIDLPDFNFQVVRKLKKRGKSKAKLIHYVAPSVWAWREKRAKKISEFLDGILCLFPFEPAYFEAYNLPAKFIGHPMIENNMDDGDGAVFRNRHGIDKTQLVIGLFPGSRPEELKKLGETLKDTVDILLEQYPDLTLVIPTLPQLEYNIRAMLDDWDLGVNAIVISDVERKWNAFAACDVALAVSGTVGLELAYMKVPHVIGYKMNLVSWFIVKLMVKIKNAHLANILLERTVVPEFLQHKCNSVELSRAILNLIKIKEKRTEQCEAFAELRTKLSADMQVTPSIMAADFILKL